VEVLIGRQLAERLSNSRIRQSFLDYTSWAISSIEPRRFALTINRHIEFFVELEKTPGEEWSSTFLLRTFGTHGLRKFELPVRWLREVLGVELTKDDKLTTAELQNSKNLLQKVPPNTEAKKVLDEFFAALESKRLKGKVQPRSVRLALRPAVSLLQCADPEWNALPDQKALDQLLSQTPGQRAAVSTFLSFLKRRFNIELTSKILPAKKVVARRKHLGEQLASMTRLTERDATYIQRWNVLALAFFHHLSLTDAKKVLRLGTVTTMDDGCEIVADSGNYWIPQPTSAKPIATAN
jgi:hypothetical protein